ncbi:hypothetical protein [Sporosarcina highlanderae]|uniref:Uncharacterized protein n=1 Tax=Sporosarcina highlanderae TaxID=3035916 RepID=A0ABT8JNZ4_9BACL|nr:hypothetical protein [Sporosarcina highlanderae]MDN4606873.1 hypothetical protein [Sporosarcina highlanderae]
MKKKVIEEESTSVFVLNEEVVKEIIEVASSRQMELKVADPNILTKIQYLSGPFQRSAYKPLQFMVEGKSVKGAIQRIEDDLLWIDQDDEVVTKIEIGKIEDVLWRGQSFERD